MNSMLSHRRWTLLCIGILVLGLGLVSLTTIIIDPFFHYHAPLKTYSIRLIMSAIKMTGSFVIFPMML